MKKKKAFENKKKQRNRDSLARLCLGHKLSMPWTHIVVRGEPSEISLPKAVVIHGPKVAQSHPKTVLTSYESHPNADLESFLTSLKL